MAQRNRRRGIIAVLVLVLVLIALLVLLFTRCRPQHAAPAAPAAGPASTPPADTTPQPGAAAPESEASPESLTPATITGPAQIAAGADFSITWTGPDNPGDFITIVRPDAEPNALGDYAETKAGATLELTAPIEPGPCELRYIASRSRTILGRVPIEVTPVGAALEAPASVILGSPFQASWTGPNNQGDYITIVASGAPDADYNSYAETRTGPTVTLNAPPDPGEFEVRYVSAQGRKVLARRPIAIAMPDASLTAPESAIAGSTVDVAWTGPNNSGDYITVVTPETPDAQYGNYTDTIAGSPLRLLMPIVPGAYEIRYSTGHRILARRRVSLAAPEVTLSAHDQCAPGDEVSITWTGPAYAGDYITIVPAGAGDSEYLDYANASEGSPVSIDAPKSPGDAEVRYVSGQGHMILARRPLRVVP